MSVQPKTIFLLLLVSESAKKDLLYGAHLPLEASA